MLSRIQNDLFDLGADLATPEKTGGRERLRIVANQVERLEGEIDALNARLAPLTSFVLPGGTPAAAALHLCRTVARRAERLTVGAGRARGRQRRGDPLHQSPVGFLLRRRARRQSRWRRRRPVGARREPLRRNQAMAFIPIYDTNPLRHIKRPWVAWGLIAANVVVYFLVEAGTNGVASDASVLTFGLFPAVFSGADVSPTYVPDWLTLITYSFLHADFWHLAGNMIFLWVLADNVEDALGHLRFLIFYLLCAAGAGSPSSSRIHRRPGR